MWSKRQIVLVGPRLSEANQMLIISLAGGFSCNNGGIKSSVLNAI